MTRPLSRRLLALALATALSLPAWAQTAFAPFTVSDIRIEGLQRIGAGTVFTYLPVERGDTLDQARAGEAMRALYKTGFFEDVRLDHQGSILVITVVERPAINKLTLVGNKDLKSEDLLKGLKEIGLAEGETFNKLNLDRVTQELNRQYNNRGKYSVEIEPNVERLDRNRINLTLNIKEGKAAKIRHINLVGNESYSDEDITKAWESKTSNWMSWYKRDDQYSREKLSGDIEKLNAWYLDRGYVDFSLDSTQVAISGDRKDPANTHMNLGHRFLVTGRFADALEQFQSALKRQRTPGTLCAVAEALLLLGRAVAQQRAHVVHLAMAGAGVAAAAVDLFHDHRGFRQAQARTAVFLGNQRRQPAGLGERIDAGFRVGAVVIDLLPIGRVELVADGAYAIADVGMQGVQGGHRMCML